MPKLWPAARVFAIAKNLAFGRWRRGERCFAWKCCARAARHRGAAWLAPIAQEPPLLLLPIAFFLGGAFILNFFTFGNAEQQFGAAFIIEVNL